VAQRPHLDDDALRQAVADNHRDWMARWAVAEGGAVVSVDGAELYLSGEANLFPRSAPDPDALLGAIRAHDCAGVGYWSLGADDRLGVRLVARGFGWGWRPHWMAIDLEDEERLATAPDPGLRLATAPDPGLRLATAPDPGFEIVAAPGPPYARTLPYAPADGVEEPRGVLRLGVRLREKVIGQISINPTGPVAGIYAMGVAPRVRGRGIATALTSAACRLAAQHGCRHAVLNATDEGERVYRRVGFRSLGWGQTWWYFRRPAPTARETALTEAIGFGSIPALEAVSPTAAELDGSLPGDEQPLPFALLTGQVRVAEWILARRPALIDARYEPHETTLLHLAVEHDSAPFVELALAHRVDVTARDATFSATALGWAAHFGRHALAARLRDAGVPA
jgi:GNAT superfamily N-acetyltransferase